MKRKPNVFINLFLALNISLLGLYIIKSYSSSQQSRQNVTRLNSKSNKILISHEYGDKIEDFILEDVEHRPVNLTSANKVFKFIQIVDLQNQEVDADLFSSYINLKNNFAAKKISFLLILVAKDLSRQTINIENLQKKHDLTIVHLNLKNVIEMLNLPDCRCGFNILLDENNKIRLIKTSLNNEILIKILTNELSKTFIE